MSKIEIVTIAKTIVSVALFFIWVVRYENIKDEFKQYNLSDNLRDFVGILKLSFALLIHHSNPSIAAVAGIGLCVLMFCAILVHFKVKNAYSKMIPALSIVGLIAVILQ